MSATYNYCVICGHTPKDEKKPNYTRRFWDCDDGWKIGALCGYCWEDAKGRGPKPTDFAFSSTNGVADDINTDEDPTPYFPCCRDDCEFERQVEEKEEVQRFFDENP